MNFSTIDQSFKNFGYSSFWFSHLLTEAARFIYYGNMKPKGKLRFVSGLKGKIRAVFGRISVDGGGVKSESKLI